MRKFFILVIHFLFFITTIESQFAIDGNKWHIAESYSNSSPENPNGIGYYNHIYEINGDSVFGDQNWKKIYHRQTLEGLGELMGFVRDDSLLVYYLDLDNNQTLLYNFGYEEGDSYEFTAIDIDWEMTVENISTETIGESERIVVNFEDLFGNLALCLSDKWIQGIGSLRGPLFTLSPHFFGCNYPDDLDLVCFYENNDLIWQNSNFETCYFPTFIQDVDDDNSFQVYPNPVQNYLSIELLHHKYEYSIRVLDLLGQVLQPQLITSKNNITLNLNNYPKGVYLIEVISNNNKTIRKFIKI